MLDRLNDRLFNRLALVGLLAGFLLLIIAFVTVLASSSSSQRATGWVRHTYQVKDTLNRTALAIERTETATRGYLLAPSPLRVVTAHRNAGLVLPGVDRLKELTQDNPGQQRQIALLRAKMADQLATDIDMLRRAVAGDLAGAREEFAERVKVRQIDQIRALEAQIEDAENRLLVQRQAVEQERRNQLNLILALLGLLMMVLGAATFVIVRRYTRDLTRTRDRLNLLNADLEGEVGRRTADLTRANEEIQRFAYIVSHDLRSPLVNVLGFTAELEQANKAIGGLVERAEQEAPQLLTEDVRFAREDLPEAIGFIRSSTQKMDRLINAILKLSREGRRNLSPQPLAMDAVMSEIVASLEQRLAAKEAEVRIEAPLPDLVSDRIAIEQIFSNLLENAVKYSDQERAPRIVVWGRRERERLIYEVEDNGRGIDPRDHSRIFDLFRRSGQQDQAGEGIGLAHVRALIYRLGGLIDVNSELGRGSTFTVRLPAEFKDEGDKK
ncbi:sensor histidine kinase [Sphingomonas ginkgonis]|uniref:sensor histidine kinase n=1 Tax=Sphingomonas ginkgonis TaxID=2315330 RepID=UPI001EEFBDD7|nr:sensor histidine kinase [Sphingomonas ginkgonis]